MTNKDIFEKKLEELIKLGYQDSIRTFNSLQQGLKEAAEGKLKYKGDFSCYLDEEKMKIKSTLESL